MRRVVVTGMGIVSSIGNNTQEVLASLREAKSGVVRAEKYAELGFRCHVHGPPTLDASEAVDRLAERGADLFLIAGAGIGLPTWTVRNEITCLTGACTRDGADSMPTPTFP